MQQYKIILCTILAINIVSAQDNNIGNWATGNHNLPVFEYTSTLPYAANLPNGKKVNLPSAPWFY